MRLQSRVNPIGFGAHTVGWEGEGIYHVFWKNWRHASPVRDEERGRWLSLYHCSNTVRAGRMAVDGARGEVPLVLWETQVASDSIQVPILALP